MSLVEIRTGPTLPDVRRIHERRVRAIRRVVERMAEGVGNAHGHWTTRPTQRGLQRVILRVGDILQRQNPLKPKIGPRVSWVGYRGVELPVSRVRGSEAGGRQIGIGWFLRRHGNALRTRDKADARLKRAAIPAH